MFSRINKIIYPKNTEKNDDSLEEYETKGIAPKNENKCTKYNIVKNQFVFEKMYLNLNTKRNINIDEIEDNLNIRERVIPRKVYGYNNFLSNKEIEDNEINEKKIPGSKMIPLNPILDTCKSICKIETFESQGSGIRIFDKITKKR